MTEKVRAVIQQSLEAARRDADEGWHLNAYKRAALGLRDVLALLADVPPPPPSGWQSNKIHTLKSWPLFFAAVQEGRKTFEIRKHDRDFAVDDGLVLQEWNPDREAFTGATCSVRVTYVSCAFAKDGYVAMSIEPCIPLPAPPRDQEPT